MQKIIGITSEFHNIYEKRHSVLKDTYVNAIYKSGGIPIIIPSLDGLKSVEEYIKKIDGLVLSGGVDISPLLYNENPKREVDNISISRDNMEVLLYKEAKKNNIPVLGICRGMQLMNIVAGGNLYQDIYSQMDNILGHVSPETLEIGYHKIKLKKEGFLYDVFQKDFLLVNSTHHQAIKKLGEGFKVVSKSEDGIIEAIESINKEEKDFGVQFHPESMVVNNKEFLKLFKYFLKQID